jgi:CRP-like cAMP-binding protein
MEKLRMREYDTVQFTRMVRKIKLFSNMQMGLLEKILAWVSLYSYKQGEKICRQGETGDSYFVIYEGRVSVTVRKWRFLSRRLAVLGPGDCFGEMALLRQAPRNATVTCEEDTRVFALLAEHFHDALAGNAAFAEEVRKLALEREFEDKCGFHV